MVAASNTSPVSNLALIGRLDLLRDQFEKICIPAAVKSELEGLPNPAARAVVQQGFEAGWLEVSPVANVSLAAVLAKDLDQGEAEAIALAIEIKADVLVIDEKEGRGLARQAGLSVRGTLGILLRAKATGKISSLRAEIDALRSRAKFFVARELEEEILRAAGE